MAKTPAIANPAFVIDTLTELQKTKEFNVTYHVARSFEDVGLVVAVHDHSGAGRAKKGFRISERGVMVLEKARAALKSVTEEYLDKDGNPIHAPVTPIEINTKAVDPKAKKIADLEAKLAALKNGTAAPKTESTEPKIDGRTKAGRLANGIAPAVPKIKAAPKAAAIPAPSTVEFENLQRRMAELELRIAQDNGKNENGGAPVSKQEDVKKEEIPTETVAKSEEPVTTPLVTRGAGGRFQKRTDTIKESVAA